MKMIVGIFRSEVLNDVLKRLFMEEIYGLTITEAKGHGGEIAPVETYRGTTVRMEVTQKVRLEIAVTDEYVDRAIGAIMEAAHTGDVGDGKVFVLPLEGAYRIRTGERDRAAVTPVR
jgi:nitrogen regulatory protein P-II 1